ncbi:hypothetical protein CPB85DRAFT_1302318 [Mucidula mucida]|nr:hypothetical protein CPB85DRAFT_1302318 [Mucidula mucida]
MQVNFALVYNYCYWMVSYLAEAPEEVVRYTSIVRAVEAAGGAVASGISSTRAPVRVHFNHPLLHLLIIISAHCCRRSELCCLGGSGYSCLASRATDW